MDQDADENMESGGRKTWADGGNNEEVRKEDSEGAKAARREERRERRRSWVGSKSEKWKRIIGNGRHVKYL